MRASMSLICFVCDNIAVQQVLPQILVVSTRHAPQYMQAAIRAAVSPPVLVWFLASSWMTATLMTSVLDVLHRCLEPWHGSHQVLLCTDAYKAHVAVKVWEKAATRQMLYFVVPAKMTWALQPCDTHVFASLKNRFAQELQTRLVASTNGKTSVCLVVAAIDEAVHDPVVKFVIIQDFLGF